MDELVYELRARLDGNLPEELNTDFHLRRWITAYNQDLDKCVIKFEEYLKMRKLLGYGKPESTEQFYQRPLIRRYGRFLAQTKITGKWINVLDNGLVFVEMPIENPQKFFKAIRISEYLQMFFGFCEHFQNLILEQERKTGRPSHGICIFDHKGISLAPYVNPLGMINKLMMFRVHLWLDYYSELLKYVIIVNSSVFLPAVWKVISFLLPSKVHNRFVIAKNLPDDLLPYLALNCIPIAYGGSFSIPNTLDNTCLPAEPIMPFHYQIKSGQIWKQNSVVPKCETILIKANCIYQKVIEMKCGRILLYEYFANGELIFWISQGKEALTPKFKHMTLKLSEEGKINAATNGLLSINVENQSKMFTLKVQISYAVV